MLQHVSRLAARAAVGRGRWQAHRHQHSAPPKSKDKASFVELLQKTNVCYLSMPAVRSRSPPPERGMPHYYIGLGLSAGGTCCFIPRGEHLTRHGYVGILWERCCVVLCCVVLCCAVCCAVLCYAVLCCVVLCCVVLCCVVLCCVVLCWVGLGWVGLGWVGLGWVVLRTFKVYSPQKHVLSCCAEGRGGGSARGRAV